MLIILYKHLTFVKLIIIVRVQDTLLVIEKYKSGFQPPEDFPFEDLSRTDSDTTTITSTTSRNALTNSHSNHGLGLQTVKGTISGKYKKRSVIPWIFSSNKVREFL